MLLSNIYVNVDAICVFFCFVTVSRVGSQECVFKGNVRNDPFTGIATVIVLGVAHVILSLTFVVVLQHDQKKSFHLLC